MKKLVLLICFVALQWLMVFAAFDTAMGLMPGCESNLGRWSCNTGSANTYNVVVAITVASVLLVPFGVMLIALRLTTGKTQWRRLAKYHLVALGISVVILLVLMGLTTPRTADI